MMNDLKDLKHPLLIFTVASKWSCQTWTFEALSKILGSQLLSCRVCEKSCGQKMETHYNYHMITLQQFYEWLQDISHDGPLTVYARDKYSCYIDYKYMKDMFSEVPDVFNEVRWKDFGLDDFDGYDSTIWLGSEGASTPGHQDTYGFNLVTQISGRKLWILFPPEDSPYLYPTRIPYEESSIFTMVNIRKPDLIKHNKLKHSHPVIVVLCPGQTLYVPRHWWHYVESLEPSISINVWVPSISDCQSHLTEAITRCLVTSLISPLDLSENKMQKTEWINPTETLDSMDVNLTYLKTAMKLLSSSERETIMPNVVQRLNNKGEVAQEKLKQLEPSAILRESSDECKLMSIDCLEDKSDVCTATLSGEEKDYLKLFHDKVKQMSFKQVQSPFQVPNTSSRLCKRKLTPPRCKDGNKRKSPHCDTSDDDANESHHVTLNYHKIEQQSNAECEAYSLGPCTFESYIAFLDGLCKQMKCSCLVREDNFAKSTSTLTVQFSEQAEKQQPESSARHCGDQLSSNLSHPTSVDAVCPDTNPGGILRTQTDLSSLIQLDIAENLLASVLHPDVISLVSQKFLDVCLLSQSDR